MALRTSELRREYAPACKNKHYFYLEAYRALDAVLRKHNYKPRAGVTGAYNCRTITGGSGYSLHAYGPGDMFTFWTGVRIATSLAVDINWDKNPYGPRLVTDMPRAMIDEILAIRTNRGNRVWGWGGYYSGNKDAMHFEIVCSAADLATGITTPTQPKDEPFMSLSDKEQKELLSIVRGLDPFPTKAAVSGREVTQTYFHARSANLTVATLLAKVEALTEVVRQVSAPGGVAIDYDEVQRRAESGVRDALGGLDEV